MRLELTHQDGDPQLVWFPTGVSPHLKAYTANGYMGWAPAGAQKGDIVCIFLGGDVPFIIRPLSDGHYHLLGDCYIHGIMEGQAMEWSHVKTEIIRLR
jgi:hypothetical protein